MEGWGEWFRKQYDKNLLIILLTVFVCLLLHMMHDKADSEHIHWLREMTNTVMGTLLGLITGVRTGMAITTNSNNNSNSNTKVAKIDKVATVDGIDGVNGVDNLGKPDGTN